MQIDVQPKDLAGFARQLLDKLHQELAFARSESEKVDWVNAARQQLTGVRNFYLSLIPANGQPEQIEEVEAILHLMDQYLHELDRILVMTIYRTEGMPSTNP